VIELKHMSRVVEAFQLHTYLRLGVFHEIKSTRVRTLRPYPSSYVLIYCPFLRVSVKYCEPPIKEIAFFTRSIFYLQKSNELNLPYFCQFQERP